MWHFIIPLPLCLSASPRSKKDKSKVLPKPDSSDPEPEGLSLLVPDIQRTADIVYSATTSLRQANQGQRTLCTHVLACIPHMHALSLFLTLSLCASFCSALISLPFCAHKARDRKLGLVVPSLARRNQLHDGLSLFQPHYASGLFETYTTL